MLCPYSIYQNVDNQVQIDVQFEQETFWLSQKRIAEFFDKDSDTIGLHLKKIYPEGELDESATTDFFTAVQKEGKRNVSRTLKFII